MKPTVGLHLYGHHLVSNLSEEAGVGELGKPYWSPVGLLADVELRLGLLSTETSSLERSHQWSDRLARWDDGKRFYSRSFAADPRGTSTELLRWRDGLIEAGWNGGDLNGSDRLDALSKLEAMESPLGRGRADRLQIAEAALRRDGGRFYEAIDLVEPRALWPGRWSRIFDLLAGNGVVLGQRDAVFNSTKEPTTDLARLQDLIRNGAVDHECRFRADGSVLLLTAETPLELADVVAALARKQPDGLCVVRPGETEVLDAAFRRAGIASQGVSTSSASRPLLQVVPLLLQLAFSPRDPEQLLQLLTLPGGPFVHAGGRALANSLMEMPGTTNATWQDILAEHMEELSPYYPVLKGAGFPTNAAPIRELLGLVDNARHWLRKRLASGDFVAGIAHQQASAIRVALQQLSAETIDKWTCEQVARDAIDEAPGIDRREESGRISHVDDPALLFHSFDRVLFWNFVGSANPRAVPWRRDELRALEQQGILFPAPELVLAQRAEGHRRAVLAARNQLLLAVPRQSYRELSRTHPLLDEIIARLNIDSASLSRIEVRANQLRTNSSDLLDVATEQTAELQLPTLRRVWELPKGLVTPRETLSASSVLKLLGCPLSWVFEYQAGVYSGGAPSLPIDPITYGKLGHRLVERLFERGLFNEPLNSLRDAAPAILDDLVAQEAMGLLVEGKAFELEQLKNQLLRSVNTLAEILQSNHLKLKGVESPIDVKWQGRSLNGRIDLLLETRDGEEAILDLKWGAASYKEILKKGQALQLAFYSAARQLATGASAPPPGGYFSLASAKLLVTDAAPLFGTQAQDGPPVSESWKQAQRTIPLIESALGAGTVPVTGGREPASLLKLLGEDPNGQRQHLEIDPESACKYCNYSKLCGLHWEGQS